MKEGALVISLDFELLWGVFDKMNWFEKENYFLNTRNIIPDILKLFEKYDISCTWATVGMLFNHNWEEWNMNIPKMLPQYENPVLSAYEYGKVIQSKKNEKWCFAPEIIRKIKETPGQEIATHTYSHYYCLEKGQKMSDFKEDIEKAIEIAQKYDCQLSSLVFPRNQFNNQYLSICRELGIINIRTNPVNWYWRDTQRNSFPHKICRTADAYIGSRDKGYSFREVKNSDGIVKQKASRFLRPLGSNEVLNRMRLKRVLNEMEKSASLGQVYHLWWHPHNFGERPESSYSELKIILSKYTELKNRFGYRSLNMKGLGELSHI